MYYLSLTSTTSSSTSSFTPHPSFKVVHTNTLNLCYTPDSGPRYFSFCLLFLSTTIFMRYILSFPFNYQINSFAHPLKTSRQPVDHNKAVPKREVTVLFRDIDIMLQYIVFMYRISRSLQLKFKGTAVSEG